MDKLNTPDYFIKLTNKQKAQIDRLREQAKLNKESIPVEKAIEIMDKSKKKVKKIIMKIVEMPIGKSMVDGKGKWAIIYQRKILFFKIWSFLKIRKEAYHLDYGYLGGSLNFTRSFPTYDNASFFIDICGGTLLK